MQIETEFINVFSSTSLTLSKHVIDYYSNFYEHFQSKYDRVSAFMSIGVRTSLFIKIKEWKLIHCTISSQSA